VNGSSASSAFRRPTRSGRVRPPRTRPSEGHVDDRVVRVPLCRASEDAHGQVRPPGPRLREATAACRSGRSGSRAAIASSCTTPSAARPASGVEGGEFLARGRQRGRHLDRLFERLNRIVSLAGVPQAQPERVASLGHAWVETGSPAKGSGRARSVTRAEQREPQLVLGPGIAVVNRDAPAVGLDSLREPAQVVLDVAHQFGRFHGVAVNP